MRFEDGWILGPGGVDESEEGRGNEGVKDPTDAMR
jgi:hypothetical protein